MNNADEIVRALREAGELPVFRTRDKLEHDAADLIESLQADLARVTAERDAAVADIPVAHDRGRCAVCKHKRTDGGACSKWPDRSCFEWRGVQTKGEQE